MSNILVIKAHPYDEDKSSTVKLLHTFLDTYTEQHPNDQITIVDLYKEQIPEIDALLLDAWSAEQLTNEQKHAVQAFNDYTEQFLAHDKIIIANPLWNLHIPARLKMWLDTIVVAQKTFKYTENGPIGLIQNKKVLHIQSSGSSFNGQDPASQYINNILNFIGIHDIEHLYIDGKDSLENNNIIDEAHQKATDLALRF